MHTPNALEASFIFFPQPQLRGTPEHVGLPYADIWLTAEDGIKTHAWFIRGRDRADGSGGRTVMLMTHGNGGNISVRLDQYREFITRFRGLDVFALSYRGYGWSEGSPSEDGIAIDAIAAREWIDKYSDAARSWIDEDIRSTAGAGLDIADVNIDHFTSSVIYFGRSLGSAVATRLAGAMPPDALILECPISSIPYLAKTMTPWRFLPLDKLITNRFDTASYIRDVHCPVLVMHSEFDEIVPIECGKIVYQSANTPKHFHIIPNAPHNSADLYAPENYYAAVEGFMGEHVAGCPLT